MLFRLRSSPYLMVWTNLVVGTLPADERPVVATGAGIQNRGASAHRYRGHHRPADSQGAVTKGRHPAIPYRCGQGGFGGGEMTDAYENLGNAIILQAVKDYREALRKHSKRSRYDPAVQTINEVERFFRSEWFSQLTSLDGEMLIRKLKAEVDS